MPLTTEAIARALLITSCAALVACTPLRPVDERADAGQVRRDAAQPDAGEPDAGPADSGPGDAGPGDAGPDAGVDGGPTCPDDCTTSPDGPICIANDVCGCRIQAHCVDDDRVCREQQCRSCDEDGDTFIAAVTECDELAEEEVPRDCNDGDSAIRPGILEVCDNTVDDDCDGTIDEAFCDAAWPCAEIPALPFGDPYEGAGFTFHDTAIAGNADAWATVSPGASVEVTTQYEYDGTIAGCAGCVTQVYLGFFAGETPASPDDPNARSQFCETDARVLTPSTITQTFTAPTAPGVYYLGFHRGWGFECSVTGIAHGRIGAICVTE